MHASSGGKKNGSASCCSNQQSLFDHSVIAHVAANVKPLCANSLGESKRRMMQTRKIKGLEIASRSQITPNGKVWIVPSQSSSKTYSVDLSRQTCTCLDFETNRLKCKHIYAAENVLRRESGEPLPTPPKVTRRTYPQQWPAYNKAQTNEKAKLQELLYELTKDIEDLPRKPGAGRSRLRLREMIFCAVFKVYSLVSGRRFISDLKEAQRCGYITRTPHFNTIFNYLELEEMTECLSSLISLSSLPLKALEQDFAVDSSGFSTGIATRWFRAKYTDDAEMTMIGWLKVHIMTGVLTHVVTGVEVSERYSHDTLYFKPLVDATAANFKMREVSADKAYSSVSNLHHVERRGAMPYIPFMNHTTAHPRGDKTGVWYRLWHYYNFNQAEFMMHYHKRSNVETTFSMIKGKFGERLRSKTNTAQVNEVLCKILCHNLCCVIQSMYEFGIAPDFVRPSKAWY
jgi:transposase